MVWFFFSPFYFLGFIITGIVISLMIGILALSANKIIRGPPKSVWTLRSSMTLTTLAVILGSISVVYLLIYYLNAPASWLYLGIGFVGFFMLVQWLFSPSIINLAYRVREPNRSEQWLVEKVEALSRRAGLKEPPRLVIAEVDAPNAFAYGSPIKGNYVAVTKGMLELMPEDEITAVLGHELGHLKHRDVAAILALSLIPVALFYIGRMMLAWGWLAGGDSRRGNSVLYYMGIGIILVIVGFLFQFLVTHFNRLREYYADAFGGTVTGSPKSLQRALARLAITYENNPEIIAETNKSAAMLFFVNYLVNVSGGMAYDELWFPRRKRRRIVIEDIDRVVEEMMKRKESSVKELFSTHPPIPKRLKFLENLRLALENI